MNQRNTLFYLHLTFNLRFKDKYTTILGVYFLIQIEAIVSRALQIFQRIEREKSLRKQLAAKTSPAEVLAHGGMTS